MLDVLNVESRIFRMWRVGCLECGEKNVQNVERRMFRMWRKLTYIINQQDKPYIILSRYSFIRLYSPWT